MPSIYSDAPQGHGYSHGDVTEIIPNDAVDNIVGAKWIQVTVGGTVTFRRADGTESPAIPVAAASRYGLAANFVGIQEATTATGILAYWAVGVTPVEQVPAGDPL